MKRRDVVTGLATAAGALACGGARGQTPSRVYRVGLLHAAVPPSDTSEFGAAFLRGLARNGYELGRNLVIERRGAQRQLDRLPSLLRELIDSGVDVVVVQSYPAALVAKQEGTIPTVIIFGTGDPVATGLVESLSRPAGNITGISDESVRLSPKRLEILKQLQPTMTRVAMLWNLDDLGMTLRVREAESAAAALGLAVQAVGVREPDDFTRAFADIERDRPDGLLMVSDSLTLLNRSRVLDFAARLRLPAVYEFAFLVRDGGLMAYGPDLVGSFERAAGMVARVLEGARPAELPFEEPTRFTFTVNLTTARSLGLAVPEILLALATEVIE
ncbi:ABC transporter substrate-binding protein [Methylobacterium sp. JK268]